MKKRKSLKSLSNIFFAIKLYFKITPFYVCYLFVDAIAQEIIAFFEHTFLIAYIVDCIIQKRNFVSVLKFLIPLSLIIIVRTFIAQYIEQYVKPKQLAKIDKSLHLLLFEKAIALDVSKYDDANFYNDCVWAMQRAPEHVLEVVNTFKLLVGKIIISIIAGIFVISVDFVALWVVMFLVIMNLTFQLIYQEKVIHREEHLLPISRKRNYIDRVFYLEEYFKDLRLSEISSKMIRIFQESSEEMIRITRKFNPFLITVAATRKILSSVVFQGVYLSYLFYQSLVLNEFGLSALLALYNSAKKIRNNFQNITSLLPKLEQHSLYISKIRTFLSIENNLVDKGIMSVPQSGNIVFSNVSFSYQENTPPILNDINLTIKKGQKVAFVGNNGAGKTTLVKLIMRLYDPTSGEISFAGNNIKEYPLNTYRKNFGVLFQDFELISTSLANNISMDEDEFDSKKADDALKKTSFWSKFKELPNGYNTHLTNEFNLDGVNLSGGEIQKIGMARIIYSNPSIIVLDEPSSALDAISEFEFNKMIISLSKEKTVIIISHRLSTTLFVDNIFLLENGRIEEEGNHETLMNKNGKYAAMFKLQANKYK